MQKFLARPLTAPFLFIFGLVFLQIGYTDLSRGSFLFQSKGGPAQIISPASNPTAYWGLTAGMLATGAACVAISVYAALCLFRRYRVEGASLFRPRAFGVFMFSLALFIIILSLLTQTCSHR